jgi:hypothetical protein
MRNNSHPALRFREYGEKKNAECGTTAIPHSAFRISQYADITAYP